MQATAGNHSVARLVQRTPASALDTDYLAAIAAKDWDKAALDLNGFNDDDILIRLQKLSATQRMEVRRGALRSIMWDVAARVLVLGVDVILDFGCWVRSQRDDFRSRARNLGVDFKIHFIDETEEVLLERVKARNATQTEGTFFIPQAKPKEWIRIFEPPSSQELDSCQGESVGEGLA